MGWVTTSSRPLSLLLPLLLLLELHACDSLAAPLTPSRIGIIGAGIGGATSAYKLRDKGYQLDIYEAAEVGGRAKDMVFDGQVMERGAAMIWENNLHMAQAVQELGLGVKLIKEKRKSNAEKSTSGGEKSTSKGEKGKQPGGDGFAIFDGASVVFTMAPSWTTPFKVLARYGLAPLLYGRHALQVWKEQFFPIYELQKNGTAFHSPEEMLQHLGLYNLTQESCVDHAKEALPVWLLWGRTRFLDEMASAINRCNYNQRNAQMNALAGLVSFLPAAAGSVWAVEGGNSLIAAAMINSSKATLHMPCTVSEVSIQADGRFMLQSSCEGQDNAEDGPFDAIILAAPLELSNITIQLPPDVSHEDIRHKGVDATADLIVSNDPLSSKPSPSCAKHWARLCSWARCVEAPSADMISDTSTSRAKSRNIAKKQVCAPLPTRTFQTTIATFVLGQLQYTYFGVQPGGTIPETVFVTEYAETPFSSISWKCSAAADDAGDGSGNLYKVFSEHDLDPTLLSALFGPNYSIVSVDRWSAYPRFSPPEHFAPFMLAPGIFYNNGIENAASALEMSAIAGVNNARLAEQHIESKTNQLIN